MDILENFLYLLKKVLFMDVDPVIINKIYLYLSKHDTILKPADGAFVFCRSDPIIANRVSELFEEGLVKYAMLTGGFGKDSNELAKLKIPEAVYQASLLKQNYGISDEKIFLEPRAKNGLENSKLGIEMIVSNKLPHKKIILVLHPIQIRRITLNHYTISRKMAFDAEYQVASTGYAFDPKNIVDQKECVSELLRIKDFAEKGYCKLPNDYPYDLVSYASKLKFGINKGL
jgi:hypothetical protein